MGSNNTYNNTDHIEVGTTYKLEGELICVYFAEQVAHIEVEKPDPYSNNDSARITRK